MSGRKRALLRLKEKDRSLLNSLENRLMQVDRDFAALDKKINEFKHKQNSRVENSLKDRKESVIEILDGLSNQSSQFENETHKLISEQKDIYVAEFNQLRDVYRTFTDNVQSNIEFTVSNALQQYYAQNQSFFESINKFIQDYSVNNSTRLEYVQDCFKVAQELYGMVMNLYQPEENHHNAVEDIKLALDFSHQNIRNGFIESALVEIQRALVMINRLHLALEEELVHKNMLVQNAIEYTVNLLDYADSCKSIPALNMHGGVLPVVIDVDSWSSGRLSWIIQQLEQTLLELEKSGTLYEPVNTSTLIDETLPALEKEITNCVILSRQEMITSQMRYDIARLAVEALKEQGYSVFSGKYLDEDFRNSYQINLNRIDGCEVHILVSHENEDFYNYSIDIESHDKSEISDHERRARAYELLSSLDSAGIEVGSVLQGEKNLKKLSEQSLVSYYNNRNKIKKLWQ